jgi:hypothetical protein
MTVYYCGSGGNNANAGTSWALRKLTLNGAEDIPVVAGDTVYVGPGTYRELLTVDVSGTVGNPITYIGDYTGANTDGVGGLVRITGSDNDQAATRANCVTATTKNYRTFRGFHMDTTTGATVNQNGGTDWIIDKCFIINTPSHCISVQGAAQARNTISNSALIGGASANCILFTHTVAVDNAAHEVNNCILVSSGGAGIRDDRIGGITVRNCTVRLSFNGIRVQTALTVGQTLTVNNCSIDNCTVGLQATTTAEFVEDYNNLFGNGTARTNVTTGANSLAYAALFDPRWFFQLTNAGAGPNSATQVLTPFDLSSFSQLLNVAGTSPTTTDMRGTAVQSTQREWGALEYDSTLKIAGGAHPIFGGEAVR